MLLCAGCGNTFLNRGRYTAVLFNTWQWKIDYPNVMVYRICISTQREMGQFSSAWATLCIMAQYCAVLCVVKLENIVKWRGRDLMRFQWNVMRQTRHMFISFLRNHSPLEHLLSCSPLLPFSFKSFPSFIFSHLPLLPCCSPPVN